MLKLNSVSVSAFDASDVKDNQTVKLNAFDGVKTISRKDVIATGRLVACEYIGSYINKNPMNIEKYNSLLDGKASYRELSQKHKEKKLLFCRLCFY